MQLEMTRWMTRTRASRRGERPILRTSLLALLLLSGVAGADVQRVEAVGSYGIRERARSNVIVRDEAIQRALWEGVSRVAIEEIGASSSSPGSGDDPGLMPDDSDPSDEGSDALAKALGDEILPYTRSFRILEDKGEMPVLFDEDPAVSLEYVVVVEVLVDVDRVRSALREAGLITTPGRVAEREPVRIELIGIASYSSFQSVLEALRSELGARRIETLGFARERQLLSVEGPFGPSELLAALGRWDTGPVRLDLIDADEPGRMLRFRAFEEPLPSPDPAGEGPL